MACARHDFCCYQYDFYDKITCKPQGNYCQCDCVLVKDMETASCSSRYCEAYAVGLVALFEKGTSCVSNDMHCVERPVGDNLYQYC